MFRWWRGLNIVRKTGIIFGIFGFIYMYILVLLINAKINLGYFKILLLSVYYLSLPFCGFEGQGALLPNLICDNFLLVGIIFSLINSLLLFILGLFIGIIAKNIKRFL